MNEKLISLFDEYVLDNKSHICTTEGFITLNHIANIKMQITEHPENAKDLILKSFYKLEAILPKKKKKEGVDFGLKLQENRLDIIKNMCNET